MKSNFKIIEELKAKHEKEIEEGILKPLSDDGRYTKLVDGKPKTIYVQTGKNPTDINIKEDNFTLFEGMAWLSFELGYRSVNQMLIENMVSPNTYSQAVKREKDNVSKHARIKQTRNNLMLEVIYNYFNTDFKKLIKGLKTCVK